MLINAGKIHHAKTHLLFYSLLLIATPFLMLQNYLQSFIGNLTAIEVQIFSYNVPVVPALLFVFLAGLSFALLKKFTINRLIGWLVILLMFFIGQKITDFYFNHQFYDLQYNWHYFAYGIFAWLNYRLHKSRNSPPQKIVLSTFLYALAISTFDEAVQVPLSNRIFDFGDVAKDLWGAMIGLVFVFIVLENAKVLKSFNSLRQPGFKDYLENPVSLFAVEVVFAFIFMFVSSNTTDSVYWLQTIFISIFLFGLFLLIYHFSQKKPYAIILIAAAIVLTAALLLSQAKYHKGINYTNDNLIVYNGIPVYFFDLMVFPDGSFRIVDKKKYFNKRDLGTIEHIAEDILIIGNGNDEPGNAGLITRTPVQFIYNKSGNKGLQVMVLNNPEAAREFNRLIAEGKRPMLIMHNNGGGS